MSSRPLKVCLDARIPDGVAGGVQQFLIGLASGLSRLDGEDEYLFLSSPGERAWLEPYLSGSSRPLDTATPAARSSSAREAVKAMYRSTPNSRLWALLPVRVPRSDGTVERSGAEVMHLSLQAGFRTSLPTIYQPFDLQHLHLPHFFTPFERKWRRKTYAELAGVARCVAVMSSWVKDDIVQQLQIPGDRVRVIPWAPVTEEYPNPDPEQLERTRRRFELPEAFALYPAQTFPHKNHLGLIDAVELARRRGVDVHVVCPGKQSDFYPVIARHMSKAEARRVRFVGYVTPLEIQCLYRLARFLVFPSLFEGGGMPIFEAFSAGLPVACSDVTCLPKQAGSAAMLFDPRNAEAISDALVRLWCDAGLRDELARRGRERVREFTWERTARMYRALYRQIAGVKLSKGERALLDAVPDT